MDQCLKLLQNARSDNDKMAALLLVAKLVKSDEIGLQGRKRVFKAVGFSFINRLLATSYTPENCLENPYHKIAITILACFCTDEDMLVHPQVTSKIPYFNDFIQNKSCEDGSLAEDSLQCLKAISCSSEGIHYLLKHQSLEALARAYIVQNNVSEGAKDLLLGLLGLLVEKKLEGYNSSVLEVMAILSGKFRSNQDQLKFDLCAVLCPVLRLTGHLLSFDDHKAQEIRDGLRDIFFSKIDPQRREAAFHLSATMCDLFGLDWVVGGDCDTKFLLLWLHLVAVEVKLAVEDCDLNTMTERSAILCSCFVILESTIVTLSKCEVGQGLFDAETVLQLHTVLNEAFTSVLFLLDTAASERSMGGSEVGADRISVPQQPILAATLRVLGAWLAEDSLTLAEGVYKLLPFLLQLTGNSMPQDADEDLLKFLLPGLCHLTADDKGRTVLMRSGLARVLARYMESLWTMVEKSSENEDRLCLCCGMLQNVCVTSPKDVQKFEESFSQIAALLLQIFTNSHNLKRSIGLNAIVLFVMIARRGIKVDKAPSSWCPVFRALKTPMSGESEETELSELRLIGAQELSSLIKDDEALMQQDSDWTSEISSV